MACTTQVPFTDHKGEIYTQINGVSMGSPLGPTFAEYYMAHLENHILQKFPAPKMYVRYVDDIIILANNIDYVHELKNILQKESVLTFSHELNINNKIPFLDVLVDSSNGKFTTSPYKKPTSAHSCLLNYQSECPERYKIAVIKNFISRAKLTSSTSSIFYKALKDIKQSLINNGFPNSIVDQQIRKELNRQSTTTPEPDKSIVVYYCNQFNPNYKQDETSIKNIIKKYVTPKDPSRYIKPIIYYKKQKTANLIIKNNTGQSKEKVAQTNVVYKFKCPIGSCKLQENNTYIGLTTTTLSRRLSLHISPTSPSAINKHLSLHHKLPKERFRSTVVDNTDVIFKTNCQRRLMIVEALLIKLTSPTLNTISFERGDSILAIF